MNPYTIIGILAAFAACALGGFKLGVDHEQAAQAREDQHIAQAVDAATNAAAKAIATIQPKYTTIKAEVQREISTETVYRDRACVHSPAGLLLANQALSPGPAFGLGSGKLPSADAPGR